MEIEITNEIIMNSAIKILSRIDVDEDVQNMSLSSSWKDGITTLKLEVVLYEAESPNEELKFETGDTLRVTTD